MFERLSNFERNLFLAMNNFERKVMEVAFGQKGWAQLSIVIEVDVMVDGKDC